MKILRLLNKKYLSIIFIFFFIISNSYSNEPVDIWNLEEKKLDQQTIINENNLEELSPINSIYESQNKKNTISDIQEDETLLSKKIEVVGLYDPSENGLTIDMWSKSDGSRISDLFEKIQKLKLSSDANKILEISVLTNAYSPEKNISEQEFINLKLDWLMKYKDFQLIENYLLKNQEVEANTKLLKFLVNEYLSKSEIKKIM